MSVLEAMQRVDRLIRHPEELAREQAGPLAALLGTIDPVRLEAVGRAQAELVLARWWEPRFPATVATLAWALGGEGRQQAGRLLLRSEAFERAVGEDETGVALVDAVQGALAAGELRAPAWLGELLAYEYLLSVGFPRRARGEPVDAALEERLLPAGASWLTGGRLLHEVLLCPFAWPVAELEDEPHDAEPDPHARAFALVGGELLDAPLPDAAGDALTLLASGATDEVLRAALEEEAEDALGWLRELGLVAQGG